MIWLNIRAIVAIALSALLMIAAARYQTGRETDLSVSGQVAFKAHLPN